jgi:hypothetical protein
MVLILN